MNYVTLFRPVGLKELQLIINSGWKEFPPRLSWQPIFYPVLNQPYAEQIARDWNTEDEGSGYCGFVTCFDVDSDYVARYDVQQVGGAGHEELWVPADELEGFNNMIREGIRIVNAFFGDQFVMPDDPELAAIIRTWNR
jgi:hypothetical protein